METIVFFRCFFITIRHLLEVSVIIFFVQSEYYKIRLITIQSEQFQNLMTWYSYFNKRFYGPKHPVLGEWSTFLAIL